MARVQTLRERDTQRGPIAGDDGVAALRALPAPDIAAAVKQATVYAGARLRAREHAEPALDPANLALSALEDTLAGRRRWQPGQRSLFRHLAMTIDSHVSHFLSSPRFSRLRAADASRANEASLRATGPTPEEAHAGEQAAQRLEAFVVRSQPALGPLLALVTREGVPLAETDNIMSGLGLDPADNAHRQRAYRQIRGLRALTRDWCARETDEEGSR